MKDFLWICGLLEGEGCFTPVRVERGGGDRFYPRVQANSADRDVLDRVQFSLGGRITGPYKPKSDNHSPMHHWRIQSLEAFELMIQIRDQMSVRRKRQIDHALAKCFFSAKRMEIARLKPGGRRSRLLTGS